MSVVALKLDATMNLVWSRGEGSVPAQEFIRAVLETTRRDDELLIFYSAPYAPNAGSAYRSGRSSATACLLSDQCLS
jgi:CO/xanthine dehydrogenase FAD-binding subunit